MYLVQLNKKDDRQDASEVHLSEDTAVSANARQQTKDKK